MLENVLLVNSPPLSVRNWPGVPYTDIHLLRMRLTIVSGCLFGVAAHAESLLQWSTLGERILHL